jgi:hypothetical protein
MLTPAPTTPHEMTEERRFFVSMAMIDPMIMKIRRTRRNVSTI